MNNLSNSLDNHYFNTTTAAVSIPSEIYNLLPDKNFITVKDLIIAVELYENLIKP